ncbi:MAG: ATP-binding protein, partial [Anaerolineales bacterium]|nr:ATP-binding protein [Anaerolineales bacterium]
MLHDDFLNDLRVVLVFQEAQAFEAENFGEESLEIKPANGRISANEFPIQSRLKRTLMVTRLQPSKANGAMKIAWGKVRQFGQRVWRGGKDAFGILVGGFFWCLLLGALIWWFLATVYWPAQNELYKNPSVDLNAVCAQCRLEIRHPAIALIDQQPTRVDFTFYSSDSDPRSLTVMVTVPSALIVVDAAGQQQSNTVRLDYSGVLTSEFSSIFLMNARTTAGWDVDELVICIQMLATSKEPSEIQSSLTIGVEGTGRATLRRFGSKEEGVAGHLFPLATILVSAAGLYYQEMRQRREREERAAEQQRQRAITLRGLFRESMREKKITDAREAYKEIEEKNLTQYLDASVIRYPTHLLKIADGDMDEKDVAALSAAWPDETAGALVYAAKYCPIDRLALIRALRSFPIDKISDLALQGEVKEAREKLGATEPVQAREWPPLPKAKALPDLPVEIYKGIKSNPFSAHAERAEDDIAFLFRERKKLFWDKHPVYQELVGADGFSIAAGESGCGKTALALALGRYLHDREVLACYFKGLPEFSEFRTGFAWRLLEFIKRHPPYLSLLGKKERQLLAQLLMQGLGTDLVLVEVSRLSSHSSKWPWWSLDKDDDQRRLWETEGITQLRLLYEAIETAKPHRISNQYWANVLSSCAKSLNFRERIPLVIDADDNINSEWLQRTILRYQQAWELANINILLFVPQAKARQLGWSDSNLPYGCAKYLQLPWDGQGMLEWARHRWRQVYEREHLDVLFAPNALQALINAANGNPRCFIRIW